jgi:hypothetical protein
LREVLSAGRFAVVLDGRAFHNQHLLSLEGGVLTTRALHRFPLSRIRFFFFHDVDLSRIGLKGRFGKFVSLPFVFRGREKRITARVISEGEGWALAEVAGRYFLTRS